MNHQTVNAAPYNSVNTPIIVDPKSMGVFTPGIYQSAGKRTYKYKKDKKDKNKSKRLRKTNRHTRYNRTHTLKHKRRM